MPLMNRNVEYFCKYLKRKENEKFIHHHNDGDPFFHVGKLSGRLSYLVNFVEICYSNVVKLVNFMLKKSQKNNCRLATALVSFEFISF